MGGSPPKFTLETKTLTMERVSEDPLSLSCPAQGSPVPAYRLVPLSFPFSEPIGGSAPKFTLDSKLSLVERKLAHPLTLVCPAQGSPIPSYRSLHLTSSNSFSWVAHPDSNYDFDWRTAEPMGGSSPKFMVNTRGLMVDLPALHPFSVTCPAQGSPPPFFRLKSSYLPVSVSAQGKPIPKKRPVCQTMYISEPVGGSAPKFSEKSSGFVLTEKSDHPFSLACPAQGSPTPAFRSVGRS